MSTIIGRESQGKTSSRRWPVVARMVLVFLCGLPVAIFCRTAQAEEPVDDLRGKEAQSAERSARNRESAAGQSPWFIMPMLVNVYPKLESEKLIRDIYEPAMRFFAPKFKDLNTVGTLRNQHILWTPDLAIGRVMSDHWALYMHFGYEAGKVRTRSSNISIFLLPLHNDFEIYRSALYAGVCADLFPLGMPERRKYDGLRDRLRNTRPSIGFRLTENYAGYEAKAKIGVTHLANLLRVDVKDNWWVTSFNANVGADVPITKNGALSVNAGYNFSFQRSYDFDGAEFTLAWKQYFK